MDKKISYALDFDKVDSISFGALRTFLNARNDSYNFYAVNLSDSVAERFEDTGVSYFVSICRKPKSFDFSAYEEFGGGYLSSSYNSPDGDSMIKVYGERVSEIMVSQEKRVARQVMLFGIPTPLVGSLYTEGDRKILDFERIQGKRSFSRIISEQPERLEEITIKFAKMCRELHSTKCGTATFLSTAEAYRRAVCNCREISDAERSNILEFLATVPETETCIHGDMQPSNVITSDAGDMWIDLADFGYGNPKFDLSMLFFILKFNVEHIIQHVLHFGLETASRVWDVFVREYYGTTDETKIMEIEKELEPFVAVRMVYLGSMYGFEPHMLPFVRKYFG